MVFAILSRWRNHQNDQATHYGLSCPWGELSMGWAVYGASCPWGKLSWGESSWDEFWWGELYEESIFHPFQHPTTSFVSTFLSSPGCSSGSPDITDFLKQNPPSRGLNSTYEPSIQRSTTSYWIFSFLCPDWAYTCYMFWSRSSSLAYWWSMKLVHLCPTIQDMVFCLCRQLFEALAFRG